MRYRTDAYQYINDDVFCSPLNGIFKEIIIMNKINSSAILLAICLGYSVGAVAQSMSRGEYKAEEKNIKAAYNSAKDQCGSLAGNAKDICKEEAKGKKKVAEAELEARYKPSKKADYEVSVAKAEAEYAVEIGRAHV